MNDNERIVLLEERYAHLQRHVVQQDKAVLELSEALGRLRQELAVLRERSAGGPDAADMPNERPPHY